MAGMYGCFKGKNSDSGAMASGAPDVTANQEPAEVSEECSGKKKSKFQTFKKFFARKKKKEASSSGADAELKASQSSDNVSKTSENNTLTRAEKDKGSGSKISLGSKALSHDSVFVSDSSEANEALGASQDSIHGKVKSLQLQLKQAIKLGSPPSLMCVKRTEDAGTMSEDDGLPCSPPEYTSPHTAAGQPQRNSSISMEVTDSDEDQLSCAASSRAMSPLLAVPGDFSQPASPFGCLDNSAAKHKLGLRHKACNKRKPANRLEIKAEVDPVVKEILKESSPESVEEPEEQKATGASMGEKKPKVDKEEAEEEEEEEEEEEDEEEEKAQTQHSRGSLLKDKRESEEGEDESDAEQDVSHAPDVSSSPELRLSEEEAADGPPQTLFQPTSAAPSLESPRASPEPPAGQTEYLMDPPGIAYGTERSRDESELILGGEQEEEEEEVEEEAAEEESSLLQEVLSSLKTPLSSCSLSLETEGVNEPREKETEDGVEAKEKETEEEEPVGYHEAPSSSLLLGQTTEEEEEDDTLRVSSPSSLDDDEEEVEEVVERFNQQSEKDEKEEVEEPEEEPELPQAKPETLVGEEERESAQSEGEEEAIELEVEEEEREVEVECEKEKVEEVEEKVEEAQEAMEEEEDRAEEMTETLPDEEEREVDGVTPTPDEGADVVTGEEFVCSRQQSIKTEAEPDEEEPAVVQQSKAASTHISVDEGDDDEERAEEEEDSKEQQSDQQDDEEAQQADEDAEQENTDLDPIEENQTSLSKPPPLSLPEPHSEHQSEEAEPITPSKSSTTILHINLVSPSSEKAPPSFHLPPTPEASPAPAEEHPAEEDTTEEEPAGRAEEEEEGGKLQLEEEEEALPAAAEADQSKGRFTIAPAWQRSLSGGEAKEDPPTHGSSPSSAGEEPASAAKVDPVPKPAAKPEESSSAAEGNSDNPFGVRLRKTSALHRFSSEEESSEAPAEPPAQPTSCKVESPPVSVKPSISQPISSKPTLPKKPEILGESGAKNKRISDAAAARGVSSGSGSPSWISVAKQKQKIYKENSLEEITVKKEEQERKSSLPMYVSSAASKEHNNKTLESSSKASMFELSKPSAPPEKEPRRALSPPTPVPAQLPKSQPLPCPVAPKPQPPPTPAKQPAQPPPTPAKHPAQPPPTPAKHPAQPTPSHKPLSPPTPVPPKPCTNPPPSSLPKTAAPPNAPQARSSALTSPPLPQRTAPPQPAPKPALSGQTPPSQRGLPATALPQDEPPWMALAKKKAKAWSEMPQIVQ